MCGIGGIYFKDSSVASLSLPSLLINGALQSQHRGQRSAGITTYNPYAKSIISTHKDLGLVSEVFKVSQASQYKEIVNHMQGIAGIWHTRYSTSGSRDDLYAARDEVQPFERRHGRSWKRFAISFNGNLANYPEIRDELKELDYHLDTDVDTEALMHLMALEIKSRQLKLEERTKPNTFKVIEGLMGRLDGAYNVLSMFADGDLVAFRDPNGIRPLVFGENEKYYAFSSESNVFESFGIRDFRDVLPGEILIVNREGVKSNNPLPKRARLCQFETVYFGKGNSKMDGLEIKRVRERLGIELANLETLPTGEDRDYLVVPAPWTAISAAEAYAEKLGVRIRIAIEKSEKLRGFINQPDERNRIMAGSYIVHRSDVEGRKVILFDDSIVRGETSKVLVSKIKNSGAREVHFRSTEPPIKHPCFYGIDFPTSSELIANQVSGNLEKGVAKLIGADSVIFQTIEGLERAMNSSGHDLCTACLNANYPTDAGRKRYHELHVKR